MGRERDSSVNAWQGSISDVPTYERNEARFNHGVTREIENDYICQGEDIPAMEASGGESDDGGVTKGNSYVDSLKKRIGSGSQSTCTAVPHDNYEEIHKPSRFYKVGRVFKILWSEPAGIDSTSRNFTGVSPPVQGLVYSQVRRFVVVCDQKGHSLCIPITTYGKAGLTKSGVRAEHHAIVYATSSQPRALPDEKLDKDPFPIIVENPSETIDPMSRVNFAKVYTVEHNVKVLKIGRIPDDYHARLATYFTQTVSGPNWKHLSVPATTAASQETRATAPVLVRPEGCRTIDPSKQLPLVEANKPHEYKLDDRYAVRDAADKKFWKPGRVFRILWTEPAGIQKSASKGRYSSVWLGGQVYSEIRHFVVIREGHGNVICSPIHTYGNQGTLKPGLSDLEQHAIIYASDNPPAALKYYGERGNIIAEERFSKAPIKVILEDPHIEVVFDAFSRINYAKIYTVEKYVRVQNIGRVHPDSMEPLLASSMFATPTKNQLSKSPRLWSRRDGIRVISSLSAYERRKLFLPPGAKSNGEGKGVGVEKGFV